MLLSVVVNTQYVLNALSSRTLKISLVAVVLTPAVWLLVTTVQRGGETSSRDTNPAVEMTPSGPSLAQPASTEPSQPAKTPGSAAALGDPLVLDWVAKRTAGVVFNQTHRGKLWYPGSIVVRGITLKLGETPPRFHYQLEASNSALLLGELDSRHKFQRYLRTVNFISGTPDLNPGISVSYSRLATQGGFVFRRDEPVIQTVGIIIPDIKAPPRTDKSSPQWSVLVRIEETSHYLGLDELEELKPQALTPNMVVLMQTHPGELPSSARILWLEFDDRGSLVVGGR